MKRGIVINKVNNTYFQGNESSSSSFLTNDEISGLVDATPCK